ncbi:MAG: hypothetical protein ACI4KF_02230 [Huintestinicola sp.]
MEGYRRAVCVQADHMKFCGGRFGSSSGGSRSYRLGDFSLSETGETHCGDTAAGLCREALAVLDNCGLLYRGM